MSKWAITGDWHIGSHKNNLKFLENSIRYFNDEFIPELKKRDIKKVFILGDVFDNRQTMNIYVFREFLRKIFDKLKEFELHIIVGNHDIYFNTEIGANSLEIFKDYPNVTVYEDIQKIKIENREIVMIPWQTGEFDISDMKADICMGHLDITGFNMYKSKISENGCTPKTFYENFKLTFSGHFHIRSEKTNEFSKIIYVGSPYQLNRNDANEERGFLVLDLDTLEYEHINNKKCIKFITVKYPQEVTKELIEGNVIDCEIEFNSEYNQTKFSEYIKEIEKFNPIFPPQPKIINNFVAIKEGEEINFSTISIESIITDFIKENENITNKDEIGGLMKDIYSETKNELI